MALARHVLRVDEILRPARPETPSSKHSKELAAQLRRNIKGEVRFDEGSCALYATDLSIYRQVPIGVVIPRDDEDVIKAVALCHHYSVPILGRGCGTSLAGQTCNVAVILDFSKCMNGILVADHSSERAVAVRRRVGGKRFLRCAFGDGWQNRGQCSRTGDTHLRWPAHACGSHQRYGARADHSGRWSSR